MADIYDIDFTQQAPELLPPDKRDRGTIAVLLAVTSCIQWCRDLLFTSYKIGATAQPYATGSYNKFQEVVYLKSVYYSLIDNNTDLPIVTTSWLKIQSNFLGVDQRIKFNGQRIVLEFALNQNFGGVFRPPGSSSLSDIYLTNSPGSPAGFRVGKTEPYCSTNGQTKSSDTIGLKYPFVQLINFNINIKTSIYKLTTQQAIIDFTNKYIPSGLYFNIVQY